MRVQSERLMAKSPSEWGGEPLLGVRERSIEVASITPATPTRFYDNSRSP